MEAISTQPRPGERGLSSSDDTERFRAVLFATHEDITRYCQRRLRAERVEDAVAEIFAAVWQGLERVPMGIEARPWVFGIARNKISESYRSQTRSAELVKRLQPDPTQVSDQERIDEQLAAQSDLEAVEAAAETLSADDVELLRLLAWERLSADEIAIVLGCSHNAAKIRIHRMRRRLRKAMKRSRSAHNPTAHVRSQSLLKGTNQ